MRFKSLLYILAFLYAFTASAANDFFGQPTVSFLGTNYNLVWSANSSNNTRIEDFIPKGPSYTQFENKLSVYYMKNASFEKVFTEKQNELVTGKQEGSILNFKNKIISNDEILSSYTSELSQDGAVLVVQFSAFRFIRKGSDVVVLEWEHRTYKKADNFKKDIEKHQEKWLNAFMQFDYSVFKF